jgi:hypothetical protein
MRLPVTLNGTRVNPWRALGLRCNPFPAIPRAEAEVANAIVRDLDAEPITDEADLRRRLSGCTPEFVEGCVARFRPGERVRFVITFPTPWDEVAS